MTTSVSVQSDTTARFVMFPKRSVVDRLWALASRCQSKSIASNVSVEVTNSNAAWRLAFSTAGARPPRSSWKVTFQNYKQLSKAKLSSLVVLTAAAGYVAGSDEHIDWGGLFWTSVGTFGAAACANTLNQVYEVANDRLMKRTCNRPLPTGRMSTRHALAFAAVAGVSGIAVLWSQGNALTAGLGLANIALYAGVYTPLKQIGVVNTWVGAIVGAIPPLMGWASASGNLHTGAYVFAGALFSWQMPHFMALAWMSKDDYARAGFKMLSVFDATGRRCAMVALRHSVLLLPVGAAAWMLELASPAFAVEAAALSGYLCYKSLVFASTPSQATARSLFKASLLYLPFLIVGFVVHRYPNTTNVDLNSLLFKVHTWLEQNLPVAAYQRFNSVAMDMLVAMGSVVLPDAMTKCPSRAYCEPKEGEDEQGEQPNSSEKSQ